MAILVAACASAGAASDGASTGSDGRADSFSLCGETTGPGPCSDWAPTPGPTRAPVGSSWHAAGNCWDHYSADRCQALAFAAAQQLAVGFDVITGIDIVSDPNPQPGPDFGHHTFLEVEIGGSRHQAVAIACPGISGAFDPKCMAEPVVPLGYPGGVKGSRGGYLDVPDGYTPFPSLEPAAVADAQPIHIPSLLIPIDKMGPHTIDLGTASLPNGYLTEGTVAMADPWPSSVLFTDGVVLVVRPKGGGDAIGNLYATGWHHGTYAVDVTLTFDVAWFEPGASFTLVDIVVR
jgi:hypothetical protein